MAPLLVLLATWLLCRLLGALGLWATANSWVGALRFALAAMFSFTGLAHFLPRTRPDLVRMVPPALPRPGLLVTVTGLLELAGALGLLIPGLVGPAALGLMALLVALFPANVHAARAGLEIGGRRAMALGPRLLLQLLWLAALGWVAASTGGAPGAAGGAAWPAATAGGYVPDAAPAAYCAPRPR